MKKYVAAGLLTLLSVPAFAQYQTSDQYQEELSNAQVAEQQESAGDRGLMTVDPTKALPSEQDAIQARPGPGGGGGFHPGPGGGGFHPGPGGGGFHPGPGGGFHPGPGGGGFHPGPGGGFHPGPGGGFHPGPGGWHPGPGGGWGRFPGRGYWGHGPYWWRGGWGLGWYNHFAWWPGFGYFAGACFAEDADSNLFSGAGAGMAEANCQGNSPVGDCTFVGCD